MNPIVFNAQDFLIAEEDGEVVGFGQVRRVGRQGARELASVIVKKEMRSKGLGRKIVRTLVDNELSLRSSKQDNAGIFLLCLQKRMRWYEEMGFQRVNLESLPMSLAWEQRIGSVIAKLVADDSVVGMRWVDDRNIA